MLKCFCIAGGGE